MKRFSFKIKNLENKNLSKKSSKLASNWYELKGNLEVKPSDRIKALRWLWIKKAKFCEIIMILFWVILAITLVIELTQFGFTYGNKFDGSLFIYQLGHVLFTGIVIMPSVLVYSFIKKTRVHDYFFLKTWMPLIFLFVSFLFIGTSTYLILKEFLSLHQIESLLKYAKEKSPADAYRIYVVYSLVISVICTQILCVFTNLLAVTSSNMYSEHLKTIDQIINNNYYRRHVNIDYQKTFHKYNKPLPDFLQEILAEKEAKKQKKLNKQANKK